MQSSCSHLVTYVPFLFQSRERPRLFRLTLGLHVSLLQVPFTDGLKHLLSSTIVELHSHRGTHPLRWDNIVPCPIVSSVSIFLRDGDIPTIGKPVSKGPYFVSPVTANVISIYYTEAVLRPPISQPVITIIDSPTLPATPINCKGHAETLNPPNAGHHSLFGPYSFPSSESSPSSSCEDFSQNDPVGEDDKDKEGNDHLDPPEKYPHVPFGGHAQTQSSTSVCYVSLPSLLASHLIPCPTYTNLCTRSSHVLEHAP